MERLAQWIEEMKKTKVWKPGKASRGGPSISHLFFAHDILLFAEAAEDQVDLIKQGLEEFCKASGQKVGYNKCHLYFFPNVPEEEAALLSSRLGIPRTNELGNTWDSISCTEEETSERQRSYFSKPK